jgi:outer membrane protein OmpA-like peptidoglycan-associated protein
MKNNTTLYKLFLIAGFVFAAIAAYTQETPKLTTTTEEFVVTPPPTPKNFCKNEFSVWAAGGLSTLYYEPTFGTKTEGFGGNFGFGYTRYFAPYFGILIGVEATLYSAKIAIDGLQDSYDTKDRHDGASINYKTRFDKYTEQQHLINAAIPLMLQFEAGDKHKFHAAAGFKLGVPLQATYKSSDNEFTASGYYYDYNQTLYHQPEWNYGEFSGQRIQGKYDVDLLYTGSVELGMKWELKNPQYSLYTGVYADYTFNSINQENTNNFLDYSQTDADQNQFVQNSVFTSQYTSNGVTQPFVKTLQPVAVGLKVRLGINTCGGKDTDMDGVVDSKDLCPNTPLGAPVDNTGCPLDSDKDGVFDYLDKCPNTPEGVVVDADGCPLDTDGDGVPDYKDVCPGTAAEVRGFVDEKGCPKDDDKDGVLDYKDECLNTREGAPVDAKGCPKDSDGDGVADYSDECPGTPAAARGFVDEKGCPKDSDKDGVLDYLDKCPGTREGAPVDAHGCPKDSDGDSVPDYADECPGTPVEARAHIDTKGCPKDTDGDGIFDYLDKCPKTPGIPENYGCPALKEEEKRVFEQALRGINFETGKDIIRPESFAILNDVVKILAENPNYNLEINGHTDNVGKPASNQTLSEKRAAAVKQYLVNNGISENRLSSAGFGDTRPVAPNTSVANKALNRRVEFIVKFDE